MVMLIILEIYRSDGYSYSCTDTFPIEYDSLEAAIVDFEIANEAAKVKNFSSCWNFVFGKCLIDVVHSMEDVRFYSLEEWIAAFQTH